MEQLLKSIEWQELHPSWHSLIHSGAEVTISPLTAGLEADVGKVTLRDDHFVLKVWNRHSKPDIPRQYGILKALHLQGMRVSEPVGHGRTETGDRVLLTRYHGTPIARVSPSIFKKIASMLADIHRLDPDRLEDVAFARHDFTEYFFPEIDSFPAIREVLTRLVASADMRMDRIIHGDFHLGNIVEEDGQYTVIDWTNVQLGDPRYDLSWACLLLRIYLSESKSLTLLHKYQEELPISAEEFGMFEAMACLRWLLLDRVHGLPKHADTLKKMRGIVRGNAHLPESVLV